MTVALITVDTELSLTAHLRGATADENFRSAFLGTTSAGDFGVPYQLARLKAHKLKAVFFVEALCTEILGLDVLKRMAQPILEGGHEVQLHVHPEWLWWAEDRLRLDRRHQSLADLDYMTQQALLERSLEIFERAGLARPIAFRAGNFGANEDTLKALASLGIEIDSSYAQSARRQSCAIEPVGWMTAPVRIEGVVEVPVTCFDDGFGRARPAQICAASTAELSRLVDVGANEGRPALVYVSHSFELLNRIRSSGHPIAISRFNSLCAKLGKARESVPTVGFADVDWEALARCNTEKPLISSNPIRTLVRMCEQAYGNFLFEGKQV